MTKLAILKIKMLTFETNLTKLYKTGKGRQFYETLLFAKSPKIKQSLVYTEFFPKLCFVKFRTS